MTDINKNMELWRAVEKTNPAHTKPANIGGHKITAIAPQYQIMKATEQFGPYGRTWGFKAVSIDYSLAATHDLVVFTGDFFYPGGAFQIISSIKLFMDNAKTKIDDDFAKKVETDALTKGLSKIGFNADVFLGRFDDNRYVQHIKDELKAAAAPVIAAEQVIILRDALAKAEYPEDGFLKKAGLKSIADMPEARFNGALAHIQQVGQSVGEKK